MMNLNNKGIRNIIIIITYPVDKTSMSTCLMKLRGNTLLCLQIGQLNSNVPSDVAFAKGYNEAHVDWLSMNGRHGFDDSTRLKDKIAYQLGYKEAWADASKGIYQQVQTNFKFSRENNITRV